MKRIVEVVVAVIKVHLFMFGLVMCMCETSDFNQQIYVSLAGMTLMLIIVLPVLFRDWRETWRTS